MLRRFIMPTLHIFNPDSDYALSSDREYYTPPSEVLSLRKRLALLPALYAEKGDAILLLDQTSTHFNDLEHYDVACEKSIEILTVSELETKREDFTGYLINPWGWNKNIRRILLDIVPDPSILPSMESLKKIRTLSHRRTTISFLQEIQNSDSEGRYMGSEIKLPKEIFDIEEALEMFGQDKRLFFKAPWSSAGRGLLLTDDLERKHVEPWLRGIIKRQGSVMAECAYDRKIDFATEWLSTDKGAEFLGYSVFNVSRRGKYHSNVDGDQTTLKNLINSNTPWDLHEIVMDQKRCIDLLINPFYHGPLGIDMLITNAGNINPCVEINLRHTMGMLKLLKRNEN